ncbi:MAG: transglycosylase SLT domain-containing protein [Alphaproteobacteria bacterium]|nr:transglycosylase SLT domain-containing protein [Alphaproteobacteria bacterium]
MLSSVAKVESGKRDPATGAWQPWPWTINIEGEGRYFETEAEAIDAVRAVQAKGVRSIDVGCMQVNLMHHPAAFESLEQAFDPRANVLYARQFLLSLYRQSGDWPTAVGLYHSATPALAASYRQRVLGVRPQPIPSAIDRARTALALAWGATLTHDKASDGSPSYFGNALFGSLATPTSPGRPASNERVGVWSGHRTR